MTNNHNQLLIGFQQDSATTVSFETAKAMMTIVGAPSMTALVQHALVLLRRDIEVAYPLDDGDVISEHFVGIARRLPNGINYKITSTMIDE